MQKAIIKSLEESANTKNALTEFSDVIELAAKLVIKTYHNKGKVLLLGNGGSAADAQHIAAEFVVRFAKSRLSLPAIALSCNSSIITACSNDTEFNEVFRKQIESLAQHGDCIIAITTSGTSLNIINAVKEAKKKRCSVISLIGKKHSPLCSLSDVCIAVPSSSTPRIQEAHITIGHIICQLVEETLF